MSSPQESRPDFAPPVYTCPACGAACKRHSVYRRRIKDVSLDGPVTLEVPVGNYRCLACNRFFRPEPPFAGRGKRYTDRAIRKATASVQQDKTTYTGLPARLERDFAISPSKSSGWRWFQHFAGSIDIEEYLRWARARFSGQLSVDSVSDGGVEMWFATDPLNRDLILGYHRADSANAESLTAFLTTLRDRYGIRPLLFTCDDAIVFDNTPQRVWPGMPVQLCHFHAIKSLSYNRLRLSLKARLRKCRPVKPPKPPRSDGQPLHPNSRGHYTAAAAYARRDYNLAQEVWAEMHRKRRLFLKGERNLRKPASVKREEAANLAKWCERYPELGAFRAFVVGFYGIMGCKDAASAELLRRTFIERRRAEAANDEHFAYVLRQLGDDRWFGRLFPFTAFENAQRTTNSTERANRWFRKRQKTHYRNRKEHTIRNMLHADLIYRRDRGPSDEPPVRLVPRPVQRQQSA